MLLDQRICCGVGNVYKSEVAAACGVHPLTPVERLDETRRRAVVETAARQLRANLTTASARTTMAGPPGHAAVSTGGAASRAVGAAPRWCGPHRRPRPAHLLVPRLPAGDLRATARRARGAPDEAPSG